MKQWLTGYLYSCCYLLIMIAVLYVLYVCMYMYICIYYVTVYIFSIYSNHTLIH